MSCHIFSSQYDKRYSKSSACEPFEAEYPKRYQNHFFSTPEKYDEHPRPLYMGVFPRANPNRDLL